MSKECQKTKVYSALEVATICGVVNQTAINWIKSGHLVAFTTPGGQFRVYPEDLVKFMTSRNMKIPESLRAYCNADAVNKNIIVIDDDTGFNDVVAKYLKKIFEDITVYQSYDVFDAGSKMILYTPRIVILNLDIPGLDGSAICRKIKEDKIYKNPSIITLTLMDNVDKDLDSFRK